MNFFEVLIDTVGLEVTGGETDFSTAFVVKNELGTSAFKPLWIRHLQRVFIKKQVKKV